MKYRPSKTAIIMSSVVFSTSLLNSCCDVKNCNSESEKKGSEEGNILCKDALNTFYLWLYGIRLMVKNHSDSKKGTLMPQGVFYMHNFTDMIAHTTAFVTPVMKHCLEWEMTQWIHHEEPIRWLIALWADTLPQSFILLLNVQSTTNWNLCRKHFIHLKAIYFIHLTVK